MQTNAQTTLIVPGLNGSGPGHWQDFWLHDRPDAALVEQEDWACPRLADWLHRLEAELVAHPGAILVAHSLGTLLVAHLAKRPAGAHVGGALLVAPCDLSVVRARHPGAVRFGAMPQERLPFPAFVVASTNDPYMGIGDASDLAAAWGAPLLDLGEAGHINVASGFGRWEDGYALAAAFAGRIDRGAWEAEAANRRRNPAVGWTAQARETVGRLLASDRRNPAPVAAARQNRPAFGGC